MTDADQPRGVLRYPASQKRTVLERRPPPPSLAPFIEVFWMVHWDLRDQAPFLQENIPDPCAHLTIDAQGGNVTGPVRGRFQYWLRGCDRVYGIKFHPGGMQPFFGRDIVELADQRVPIEDVFGHRADELIQAIRDAAPTAYDEMIQHGADYLCQALPAIDPKIAEVRAMVAHIAADASVSSVEQLAAAFHLSKRSLQRLFRTYIGLSPKWLIRCHRLQEALAQIEGADAIDWAQMALSLGYFDQAHFIGEFKAITGRSPTQYQRELQTSQR